MELTNFVFKPKNLEIAKMVIEGFVNDWLHWHDHDIYIGWTDRDLPHGYIKFYAESENPSEYFSECCFSDDPVTSRHLTDYMMIALEQDGFFDAPWLNDDGQRNIEIEDARASGADTDDPKWFSFEDVELSEIVAALSANDSRVMSFCSDHVFLIHKKEDGAWSAENMSLSQRVLAWSERTIK